MGAEGVEPGAEEAVKAECHRVLWDMRPFEPVESQALLSELEAHARALGPRVAALVPDLELEAGDLHGGALHILRQVDGVLSPSAPASDPQARLHDLAVTARALSGVILLADKRARERATRPADDGGPAGWLVAGLGV
ncbi:MULTISPECIES: hypothetical protein [Streptomyces]|uniref:hypothetical protein n=1 Tax=Streptomyces TaxID=1883 RepID=UPI00073DC0E6|nr:hypothetical protein [Streptomyces sp. EAS-AB2608]BCM64841.1 hypothetical protein EASAB2608_00175 [Streptomyces sp. EAS-AB2608]CUW32759.1 hypothetical protein TUE45_pSRTUE45c_0127 [Streptomyces reticuli]